MRADMSEGIFDEMFKDILVDVEQNKAVAVD